MEQLPAMSCFSRSERCTTPGGTMAWQAAMGQCSETYTE